MFLSIEWHHKSAPRGWSWYGAVGAGEMSAERRRQIENERPPYCQCTIKWRDSAGIFWTIEKWLVKDLPNPYGFEAAFVLKRDGEAFLHAVKSHYRLWKLNTSRGKLSSTKVLM